MNAAAEAPVVRIAHAAADVPPLAVDVSGWVIPEQFMVECRALTAALIAERAARPSCIVSLTAARPGAGVTTLARCLARYLAQGVGEGVLLVDAVPRGSWRAQRGAGESAAPAGYTSLGDAVRPTTESGLYYLQAGTVMEAIPGERLGGLVGQLRSRYPYVILDLPPVLAPAFDEAVVRASDAAMLVVEPDVDTMESVQKTVSMLRQMTRLLGIVFNRAGSA